MKKILKLCFFLFLFIDEAVGQDANFTQFYANPLYLNPAFAGTTPHFRVSSIYRNQWTNLGAAYGTNMAAFDYNFDYYDSGLGILIANDRMQGFNSTSLTAMYSYRLVFSDQWVAQLGLEASGVFKTLGKDLVFGDQLQNGSTAETFGSQTLFYPDFGTGFLLYNPTFWAGFSVKHITRPSQSFYQDFLYNRLEVHYSAHLGKRFLLSKDEKTYLSTALLYQTQGKFQQIDAGFNFFTEPVMVGLWYRGFPFASTIAGIPNHDALAAMVGVHYNSFWFGYSYDYTISGLKNTGGSHEITVIYSPSYDKRHHKKGTHFINCPIVYGF